GSRIVLHMLKPGDMFGEIIAFSDQSVWPATVQAMEDAVALFIPREKIIGECQRLCPWHRAIIRNMLRIVSNRALMLNKRLEILTIKSMRGKLCAFFLDQYRREGHATFTLSMNRNQLADFLNVSRPSMSRELARMKEEGLIDYHLSSIRLLDIPALERALDEGG
ncbi:MAG TPA: Crp/Fnr family transcriptional regulator, partial [Thermoclostridium caenicola]|nr:Crp/Fnr family transcriptional regulator [Thermoclostridium caenicola]